MYYIYYIRSYLSRHNLAFLPAKKRETSETLRGDATRHDWNRESKLQIALSSIAVGIAQRLATVFSSCEITSRLP